MTWATYGSDRSGGLALSVASVEPSDTSVTTPKKRIRSPCSVTNVPTFTPSTDESGSSLTCTPSVSEPDTTMPSLPPTSLIESPFVIAS